MRTIAIEPVLVPNVQLIILLFPLGFLFINKTDMISSLTQAPANYKFGYAVKDIHTGDDKQAWESRHGDQVKGSYSLVEPDGTKRIVDYTSDKIHGFNAVVKKIGHSHHPIVEHHGPLAGGFGYY